MDYSKSNSSRINLKTSTENLQNFDRPKSEVLDSFTWDFAFLPDQ